MTEEVKTILNELSLEEKIALCSGKDFWHTEAVNCAELPEVMMCDGPHGLRKQDEKSDHLGINESIKTVGVYTGNLIKSIAGRDKRNSRIMRNEVSKYGV